MSQEILQVFKLGIIFIKVAKVFKIANIQINSIIIIHDIEIGKFPFAASGRAMAIDEAHGFVKVIIDKADKRLLGIHVVGPEASDLISEAALGIEMGAYAPDIGLTIHPHPTLGEAVMEAAKHAVGEAVHIPNRRKR